MPEVRFNVVWNKLQSLNVRYRRVVRGRKYKIGLKKYMSWDPLLAA